MRRGGEFCERACQLLQTPNAFVHVGPWSSGIKRIHDQIVGQHANETIPHVTMPKPKRIHVLVALLTIGVLAGSLYFRYFGSLPESTIVLFPEMRHPVASDRILVFSPHQDDETLGAGAYISEARRDGAEVLVVFATDGNFYHLKALRHAEALKALKILGVPADHVVFFDFPDRPLSADTTRLDQSIGKTIAAFNPTIVFTTDEADSHPDHAALGRAVRYAVGAAGTHPAYYTFLIHYREYPHSRHFHPDRYLLPPIDLLTHDRQWLRFSVAGPDFVREEEAVAQYKSQLHTLKIDSLLFSFVRQNEMFSRVAR